MQQTVSLEMADKGRSDFCVASTMSLCTLKLKQTLISLLLSHHKALKIDIQTLRSYLKLIHEYDLHTLPNTKVSAEKDHGESYMNVRPPLVRHLLRNPLLLCLIVAKVNFNKVYHLNISHQLYIFFSKSTRLFQK